jgi:large repetitive protein
MKNSLLAFILLLLSFAGYSQCTLNVNLSSSGTAICSGNSIVLTASPSGGTAPYTYVWNTGEVTASIIVNKPGNYTIFVSDKTPGCPQVSKSVTITSSPTPRSPTAAGVVVCQNNSATLTATAPGGNYQWYDALTGGNFLGSGATYTTPPLTIATTYYVETTIAGCSSTRTPVNVTIAGSPQFSGASICAGNTATLLAGGADSFAWYAAPGGNVIGTGSTFTTPVLFNTTKYFLVGTTNGCASPPIPVIATIIAAPPAPTALNITVCSGSVASLHANSPVGVLDWFNVPTGGISLITSQDFTTPPLTTTTTYYVQTTFGCVSARTPVTVTVNPIPQAPIVQGVAICSGTSAALTPTGPGGIYQWYDALTGGNLLATGTTFNTPVLNNTTTYYVQTTNGGFNGGCTSTRTPVTVTVNQPPPAPSASGIIICSGTPATLTATAPGGIYQWFDAGGNLLATGASYTTPPLATNTTYFVQTTVAGCVSAKTPVTVTILALPQSPTSSNVTICSGNIASVTAFGAIGGNYEWFDSANGGIFLSSGQVYVTAPLLTTTTYYVQTTNNLGCASLRTPVTVTVNPVPLPPTANGTNVCFGTTASLTATAASGAIEWYNAPIGGNLLATGNNYTTTPILADTAYYLQNINGGCPSQRTRVLVSVISVTNPQFQYPSGTICASGGNPTPVINNPSGGTFSVLPAGLVFINNNTGQINVGASLPGNYVISFAGNGACAITTTAQIAIGSTPNAQFSYTGPFCQGGVNPLPTFPAGSSGGVFTALPTGLVFITKSTGQIDLNGTRPGTYTITNTIAASGSCPASSATTTVTINQIAIVDAGPNQIVMTGSPVQLAGSITGGATTGTWSGGAGTFSNSSLTNAVYTPAAGEKVVTLTLTSADPPGPCGPASDNVTITINPIPPAPSASGMSICSGNTAVLSATAPGGFYQWWDAPTGGTLLATGPTFNTPPIIANTTYYVQTTIGGVNSNRTAVTVIVNTTPAAPLAQGLTICMGSNATLTASGSAGTYEWYDSPVGGNLLSVTNTYVTPVLTSNTSYYVQATVNGCSSTRTQVNVLVNPLPGITSSVESRVCNGNALNYTITSGTAGATFTWSRAQVAGISNPAVTNQTTGTINETLLNTGNTPINVTYVIIATANNCSGAPFNYVVTVNPAPVVTSVATAVVCYGTPVNYTITFNAPGTGFTWSRATVAGISNPAVAGQAATAIHEVLFNITNAPIDVTYVFNYATSNCAGTPFNFVVTVNPLASITSARNGIACSGIPQNYVITSNVPSATFTWSRAAVANISNPAVFGQISGTINETLINTSNIPVILNYLIVPMANGCPGPAYFYTVVVNPSIATPIANGNSPVCVGDAILLQTPTVPNATYLWTGPNGFTSSSQNTIIQALPANAGTYNLYVIINGCTSAPAPVQMVINIPAKATAGPDQIVCPSITSITLAGTVTGGTTTGVWTTGGTGSFFPKSNQLNAQYIPSAQDEATGFVTLTLTSTSKDNCAISTSNITIRFQKVPGEIAGPNQSICSQDAAKLNGQILIPGGGVWSTSGTGIFSPSAAQLNASYIPSAADITSGSVTLTLTANAPSQCYIPTDAMTVTFIPPPTVNAGGVRYVLKGKTITLTPTVSDNNVQYLWTPNVNINNDTYKNPTITGNVDIVYTLTVTDSRGCVSSDQTSIVVTPQIDVPNTFTPNGDGINDQWNILGLVAYQEATVDVFDRFGQKVFHSVGYGKPWDGTYSGKQVPFGTYYYIIDTKLNGQIVSGYITVIR